MNIIIFGPQASGKGTQAKMLAKKYELIHISTGDIFRKNIKEKTELGEIAAALINDGKRVPDNITNKVVKNTLLEEDYQKGFILDGYPRTYNQAEFLDNLAYDITYVINLEVPREELLKRITGRRECKPCGLNYNINIPALKPKENNYCDKCHGELTQRKDDKDPKAVEERLRLYDEDTKPLLGFYEQKGILVNINGNQEINNVFEEIIQKIK